MRIVGHISQFQLAITIGLVFGMALTLEGIQAVKERCRIEAKRNPAVSDGLRAFFKSMQALGNLDLQLVPISGLETADKVLADVACKLYGVFIQKPSGSTVDSWFKISAHASAAAANGDVTAKLVGTSGGNRSYFMNFGDGLPMTLGATAGAHTTVNGSSKSLVADAPTGFAIVGAA